MSDQEVQSSYVKLIRDSFPEVPLGDIKLVTKGWDHDVIIVDDKTVFRFPKREEYKNSFRRELKLLDYLKDKVDIQIPDYVYVSPDQTFGGYPILPGQEMWEEAFQKLDAAQKETIAQQLGSFLTTLHNVPLSVVRDMGFAEGEGGQHWSKATTQKRLKQLQELIFPKLEKDEIVWITNRFEKYLSLRFECESILIHGDFTEEHILFDPGQGNMTGIIDFGDTEIADPMLDFAGLWEHGKEFVYMVLSYYQRPTDADMLARSQYPMSLNGIEHMLEIAQGKVLPLSWKENYAELQRSMELYPS